LEVEFFESQGGRSNYASGRVKRGKKPGTATNRQLSTQPPLLLAGQKGERRDVRLGDKKKGEGDAALLGSAVKYKHADDGESSD